MKPLLLFLSLFFSFGLYSQSVTYTYDNAGNRIARVITLATTAAVAPVDSLVQSEEIMTREALRETAAVNPDEEIEGEEDEELVLDENDDKPLADIISEQSFKIYPNPTKGQLAVEMLNYDQDLEGLITLFDMNGKMIDRQTMIEEMMYFDLSDHPNGVYLLTLKIKEETVTWKIIKE